MMDVGGMKNTVITPQTFSGLRQSWQRGSPTAHGVWRFSRRALRGDVARPVDRAGKIWGDLVSADDEKHALRPVDRTGHAVAEAVDVDDLAILAHAVSAAEIGLRLPCPLSRFRRMVLPVPKYLSIVTLPPMPMLVPCSVCTR